MTGMVPEDVAGIPRRWHRAVELFLEQTPMPGDVAAAYLSRTEPATGEPGAILDMLCPGCARSADCSPLHPSEHFARLAGDDLEQDDVDPEACRGCGYLCPVADELVIEGQAPPEIRSHPSDGLLCMVRVERGRRTIADAPPEVDGQDALL